MNVGEYLRRAAARRPEASAIVENGQAISYRDLERHADATVSWLLEQGLRPGDRVAALADNGSFAAEAFYAAALGGFTWVPINFRSDAAEVRDLLTRSGARVLFTEDRFRHIVEAVRRDTALAAVVNHGPTRTDGTKDWEEVRNKPISCSPRVDVDHRDRLCILYTSGTTGRAKGVVLRHGHAVHHASIAIDKYGLTPSSRFLASYPHNSAATINLSYVPVAAVGATVVLDEVRNFSASRFFERVERDRVTTAQLVPTMLFRLLEHGDITDVDLSSLETLGYGSASIPPQRVADLLDRFGPILQQGYGMTETSSLATFLSKEDHLVPGAEGRRLLASCGLAVEGIDVRIVDEEGRPLPAGELGEVVFRGPYVTDGYWEDEERTAEAIHGGWLFSGDMGRMDAQGYLTIVDRKKDLIISGGANISSTEVEAVLDAHPQVSEVAVVGVPDDEWGERVHAVIVLTNGATVGSAELLSWARSRLATYKAPKSIDFVEELPHNATGKVVKSQVRASYR